MKWQTAQLANSALKPVNALNETGRSQQPTKGTATNMSLMNANIQSSEILLRLPAGG